MKFSMYSPIFVMVILSIFHTAEGRPRIQKRFIDVSGAEARANIKYIEPSKSFCNNEDKGSPIALGAFMGHRKKGEKRNSLGASGESKLEDTSIFHPSKQILRFNKRYRKIRDLVFYQNDGEKVIFAFQENFTSDASVRGENWDDEYIFAMGQFQWTLESLDLKGGVGHTINGVWFPLEIELIHYRKSDGNLEKAWKNKGVLIISILFQSTNQGVAPLTYLLKNLPLVEQPGPIKLLHGPVNFNGLFPFGEGWFEYTGSYTFPPCYENVRRIILETPLEVDINQLEKFRNLVFEDGSPMVNNYHPLQPINGRTITYNKEGYVFSTRTELKAEEMKSHKHGRVRMKPHVHDRETGELVAKNTTDSK